MDETINSFLKCCLELGKELLDKDELTKKEENFLEKLNEVVDKYID